MSSEISKMAPKVIAVCASAAVVMFGGQKAYEHFFPAPAPDPLAVARTIALKESADKIAANASAAVADAEYAKQLVTEKNYITGQMDRLKQTTPAVVYDVQQENGTTVIRTNIPAGYSTGADLPVPNCVSITLSRAETPYDGSQQKELVDIVAKGDRFNDAGASGPYYSIVFTAKEAIKAFGTQLKAPAPKDPSDYRTCAGVRYRYG